MLQRKNLIVHIIALSTLVSACGGKTENDSSTVSNKVEVSCLADLVPDNEIEKMISADQVAAIVKKPVEDLEFSESKARTTKYSTFGYNWDSEEKRVGVMEIDAGQGRVIRQKIPFDDQIDIGNLEVLEPKKRTSLEYFDLVYGPKTAKQKEREKEAIDRTKESNEDVDEEAAESLKSMVDKRKGGIKLDGIGDRAYWGENEAGGMVYVKLKVLQKNTAFEITADVSDDTQEDLRIAAEVAKQIISNCNE